MLKDTLLKLVSIPGPSGAESACAEAIKAEMQGVVDEITTDVMGNLICLKKGKGGGKKIMLSAHMDQIGFVVTGIEENGFVRVTNIGGVNPAFMLATHLVFKSGAKGVLFREGGHDKGKEITMGMLFADIGAATKAEALTKVQLGDWAVVDGVITDMGDRVAAPYMDDRAACAVLVETMKRLETSENDIYAVFSTQEEVGLRGARTAAYAITPDIGVAIDVTPALDHPLAKESVCGVKLGAGAAIKVMDQASISHPAVKAKMEQAALDAQVKYQFEVLERGGTDAGAIHITKGGVPSGTLSIPCRYVHAPCETVDMNDMEACVRLLVKMLA